MSIKSRKDIEELQEDLDQWEDQLSGFPAGAKSGDRPIRRVSPLGMRVLVRILADKNVSDGGLYLPEGARQNMAESLLAKVLEVASVIDRNTREEANISGIPMGASVLIKKSAGVVVPWDDSLRIVETAEVLAVVHEIELT